MARQRAFGSILVAASVLALIMPANVAAARPDGVQRPTPEKPVGGRPIKDSWIVTVDKRIDPTTAAARLSVAAGGRSGAIYTHALRGFVFHGSAKAAKNLAKNPHVRTIVADRQISATAEILTPGVKRILADHPTKPDAHDSGFTGAGARVAIVDTGIDLTHPDLVDNLDAGLGKNCVNPNLPPQDGHGHGTHVAGIVAAVAGNGIGVVGVAPSARLVPFKVLDDTGNGEWSEVICALDVLTGYLTDSNPANDVSVANMSLGDVGSIGTCTDGGLRQAFCTAVAAGLVITAASGNSFTDASTFIPAAFPEVITVSAMADFDGNPGGQGGCKFIPALLSSYCDDTIANFSNVGSVIDVTAPGVDIFSSWTGGGYMSESGTSMAAPYVAGVAALVRAANPSLSAPAVETLIKSTGDNPDGTSTRGGCASSTQWSGDRDGIAEPIVNAYRAAEVAADPNFDPPPTVAITSPAAGPVTGTVSVATTAGDPDGITAVQTFVDGASIGTDTTEPYTATWNTSLTFDGAHRILVKATDSTGATACATVTVTVGTNRQGTWVGNYGVDGYVLGAWNGTTGDLALLPTGVTYTVEQGTRTAPPSWPAPTTDVRGLQNPTASERRAGAWYHATEVRLRLTFTAAYSGTLNLYAVDWGTTTRREDVTVDDGSGPRTANLSTSFNAGAWVHYPITVAAGGSVVIKVVNRAGSGTSVLSGLFLGGAGDPPLPPPPPPPSFTVDRPGVQGTWVGNYGVDGYVLGAWNGTTGDLALLPTGVTYTVEQGTRTAPPSWPAPTTDVRGLQNPTASERRAGAWYHATEVRLRLTFTAAYSGTLNLYAVDWGTTTRREDVTVDDGSGPRTANLSTSFNAGAWVHYPITVAAGGSVVIKVVNRAGSGTSVLSGLFLGGAGDPPLPPPPPPPSFTVDRPGVQGTWVGNYGVDGYVLGAWNGTTGDLALLPTGVTYTVEQGTRTAPPSWPAPTTDVRGLQNPTASERRAGAWYHATEVRLRLTFTAAYSGTLNLYAVDWGTTTRREDVTVDDGSGPRTANLSTSFNAGAWVHYPITVAAGGSVVIKVVNRAGSGTSVLSGLFLGGAGDPPLPPPPPPPSFTVDRPGVQGTWVGNYGVDGYVLGAWNGTTGDLALLPTGVTYTVEQGTRTAPPSWPAPTTDVRGLQNPTASERRAGAWYHATEVRLRLTFTAAYSGTLNLYAVDWGTTTRREDVTVDDGSGPRTANLSTSFNAGAWVHYPITVAAGGSVVIKVVNRAGSGTSVLSGLFLGGAVEP